MSKLKIACLALVGVLGAASMASAATTHVRRNTAAERASPADTRLHEGRSVYTGPTYQYQAPVYGNETPVPMTQLDGSNAPAH